MCWLKHPSSPMFPLARGVSRVGSSSYRILFDGQAVLGAFPFVVCYLPCCTSIIIKLSSKLASITGDQAQQL